MNVIEKAKTFSALLQQSGADVVETNNMINALHEITNANVTFLNTNGEIKNQDVKHLDLDFPSNNQINSINDVEQVTQLENGFAVIAPICNNSKRHGSVVVVTRDYPTHEDIAFSNIVASLIGKSIVITSSNEEEVDNRNKMAARNALKSLSFTEICAIQSIFDELQGNEGLLVASKIADRVGFTRSVIVNAVRKLEGASVVESRSLGMKGTHIKILNNHLLPELAALNK
ncbi:MAG: transcriptional repressor CodY [Bacillales bacterium]|jgi:transcriptional pleiotropic repressor|nr:transcriptional repressor CodY [Bacillales bacterium]